MAFSTIVILALGAIFLGIGVVGLLVSYMDTDDDKKHHDDGHHAH